MVKEREEREGDKEVKGKKRAGIDARIASGSSEALPTLPKVESSYLAGRRSMAYELLESGGLPDSRLGLEILFLLPDWFVEYYQEVYHRALKVDDQSVMHGRLGGLDKAKGAEGLVLGSEVGAQAKGSGKRWKNRPISVKSEKWLKIKEQLDHALVEAVQDSRRAVRAHGQGLGQGLRRQCQGKLMRAGRWVGKESWDFCPSCV